MTEIDKKTQSITALKNANKHLTDIFSDIQKKDTIMTSCASDLLGVARQCGEIQVRVWSGSAHVFTPLKGYLEAIAKNLEGARS